jgi:hypothetical protein
MATGISQMWSIKSMPLHASLPHHTKTQRTALHQPVKPASKATVPQRAPSG